MFKPHILALKGPSNTGKTTIIKRVRSKILGYFGDQATETDFLSKRATSDIKRIIEIGDFKIGIESQGDPVARKKERSRLRESLEFFDKENCHVIITTSRTYGNTVDYIKAYEDKYEIKWYEKESESTELMELGWENSANSIYDKVIELHALYITNR
ncbi:MULTISPECIES: hypothetical protein [Providencia]|uniref:hypothetical protein n=1 Tax=Providencia TaxID=586 RepID=UPI001B35DACF|nr:MULTISPECIES: hypothetical protein [Providencia]MBQ0324295.1 hypothetical protein [Providencia rettgeri]